MYLELAGEGLVGCECPEGRLRPLSPEDTSVLLPTARESHHTGEGKASREHFV